MDLFHLPTLPQSWGDAHVIVVHFPLAAFPIAMALVFIAMVTRRTAQVFSAAALVVMVIGMIAACLAVSSGESAARIAEPIAATKAGALDVIRAHYEAGKLMRSVLAVLTAVYAVLFLWHVLKGNEFNRTLRVALHIVFLLAMSAAMLMMSNTAHLGGRLVHEFGIHANIGGYGQPPTTTENPEEPPR